MSLENPMVSGYSPEREIEPDYACPRCKEPLEADTPVYYWDGGAEDAWVCGDCFKEAVLSTPENERAEMSGESIKYTEQQLELVKYAPSAMADILFVDISTAEDVL